MADDTSELPRILWMFEYECDGFPALEPLYAISREEAEQQACAVLAAKGALARFVNLRTYPNGFTIHHSTLMGCLPPE